MRLSIGLKGIVVLAIAGAALLGGAAYAVIPDSSGVIHTCYLKSGGSLRVIDNSVTKCKTTETALSINQTGAPGKDGEDGAPGQDGADGVSGYEIVTASEDFGEEWSSLFTSKTATCPAGKKVLGGGALASTADGGITSAYVVLNSFPVNDSGWRGTFDIDNSALQEPFVLKVYAICASVT